ncbi:methylenetetrahydrofolate reductase [Actinomyces marmotae]|uniref:Methylenetetrahydrofolate reductase n=1 Tax=Actinomyces marmotae TaxID=2737173 RepID=A0A6M8AXU2_9ACTO|nr:methylenetetrahydrofolate reductase [Actinomyces marmotae]QKD79024.1 5,10-methylenetetrahydrofolate reductase [Actinomyces marmotae]
MSTTPDDSAPAPHGAPTLSLELFPPRAGAASSQTWSALDRLLATAPDFVSVTYRPTFVLGARPADPAVRVIREHNPAEDVVTHVLARSRTPLMAHLTCIGYRKRDVVEIVRLFLALGVRRFLALRGDPPRGHDADELPGELAHAEDLVRVIREVEAEYFDDGERHLTIAVAAYPAVLDHGRGVEVLAAKQAAGADLAITQVFYDPEDYLSLARAATYCGVSMPLLPGILPMTDLARLSRLAALTGVPIPAGLAASLKPARGAQAVTRGIDATLRLATEVLDGGAPGIHLYTFNRTRPALDVVSQLRLGGILGGERASAAMQRDVRRAYLNATPGGDRRMPEPAHAGPARP